jgi:aminoglycoside 3-N-acetyltransferase
MPSQLTCQLLELGVRPGGLLMVHSSFKALGINHPEEIIQALLDALGLRGTLLMPALTYLQDPPTFHDTRLTPSCVGYLSEYFRTRPGTQRSLHPTHSVSAVGSQSVSLLADHFLDDTPCGRHSPFNKQFYRGGQILMLGCGLSPNTSMHAVEEYVRPPYLFAPRRDFMLVRADGSTLRKPYYRHSFRSTVQRYERVQEILSPDELRQGMVGQAWCHLIEAEALLPKALACLRADPLFFVDYYPDVK